MEIVCSVGRAFLVGGILCLVAQLILNKTNLTPAKILVGYVVVGVFLTAIGIYEPIIKFAGAGASVPLTGFGYLLCDGTREAVLEKGFIGIFAGGMKACSAGVSFAMFMAIVVALILKRKKHNKKL